jgi:YYY domain-containing protein
MTAALRFFVLIEVLGLAATPLAAVAFARLPGRGVAFAKPLGLLLATWLVWMTGSLGLLPAGRGVWIAAVALLVVAGALVWRRRRPPLWEGLTRRCFLWSEAIALVAFAAMALLVAYSPDVWQTEKPMDMAFINAAGNADSFPPEDPWMAGENLNYYYLGHLMAAGLVKLSGVAPDVGYNLAVAGFFALSAVAAFGLATALVGRVTAGLWGVALCLLAGTIGSGIDLLGDGGPLRSYDWFGASRVIEGTINEFPAFSFTLADLHGHVMAIPFSLLALAFGLQLAVAGPPPPPRGPALLELGLSAIAIGTLYAINAWSFPVVAGLYALSALVRLRAADSVRERGRTLAWAFAALLLAVFAVLPFLLNYDAAANGLGTVSKRVSLTTWATDHGEIYGLFAYLVATAYLVRLARSRHPWRTAGWTAAAALFVGSLLAAADLVAVGALVVLVAIAAHAAFVHRAPAVERFAWLLIGGGLLCLLIPEVVYVKDSFDGSALYRMNTVFKLGYQAWLLLAVAGSAVIVWTWGWLGRRARLAAYAWGLPLLAGLALAALYPVAGTYARKDGFSHAPQLGGLAWLKQRAPGDPEAIAWLRDHAPRGSVVLESVGDDYSAFGHARISTFTGLPTVLGWPGHELQWAHDPGTRRADVERMYRTTDPAEARALLARYHVRYVVVGPIERADHGDAGVAKWDQLGRRVFDRDGTTVWQLQPGRT